MADPEAAAKSGLQEDYLAVCEDNTDFRDIQGSECWDWTGYPCDEYRPYRPEDMLDVRRNCPYSCGLCQSDVMISWQQFALTLSGVFAFSLLILLVTRTYYCKRRCNDLVTCIVLLKAPIHRYLSDSRQNLIKENKQDKRHIVGKICAGYFVFRGAILCWDELLYPDSPMLAHQKICATKSTILAFGRAVLKIAACLTSSLALLPASVLGQKGQVRCFLIASLLNFLVANVPFDPYMFADVDSRLIAQITSSLLFLLPLDIFHVAWLVGAEFLASCLNYAFTVGFRTILVPVHGWCVEFIPEDDWTSEKMSDVFITDGGWVVTPGGFIVARIVVTQSILLISFLCDWVLTVIAVPVLQRAQAESEYEAVSNILKLKCDCLVHLDEDLKITEESPKLAALLLRIGPTEGKDFLMFGADDEVDRLRHEFSENAAPKMLHTRLKDVSGSDISVEIVWCRIRYVGSAACFLIGITENRDAMHPEYHLPALRSLRRPAASLHAAGELKDDSSDSSLDSLIGDCELVVNSVRPWRIVRVTGAIEMAVTPDAALENLLCRRKGVKDIKLKMQRLVNETSHLTSGPIKVSSCGVFKIRVNQKNVPFMVQLEASPLENGQAWDPETYLVTVKLTQPRRLGTPTCVHPQSLVSSHRL